MSDDRLYGLPEGIGVITDRTWRDEYLGISREEHRMDPQKPSISRIVHFVGSLGSEPESHYPAIVTHVHSDTVVNLVVFPKGSGMDGMDAGVKTSVVYSGPETEETPKGAKFPENTWHWPERAE